MYLSFKLDDEHFILKIFLLLIAVICLFLIPKVNVDYPSNCEIVIDQQNITEIQINGSYKTDLITTSYVEYCGTIKNTPLLLMELIYWFYSFIASYMVIFIIYYILVKRKGGVE